MVASEVLVEEVHREVEELGRPPPNHSAFGPVFDLVLADFAERANALLLEPPGGASSVPPGVEDCSSHSRREYCAGKFQE